MLLSSRADIRATSGDDPFVAHLLANWTGRPAFGRGGALCVQYQYWDDPAWIAVGPPADIAALMDELADDATALPGHVSLPVPAVPLLRRARFVSGDFWAFRWTDRQVPAADGGVDWLTDDDVADVSGLLDRDFADASVRPGSRHVRRWAGIRLDGELVACGADSTGAPDVGFMASLVTAKQVRGRGYGHRLTAWLTNELIAEHGRVALWQYSDNTAATALYDRLGYHDDHQMVAAANDSPHPQA
ncbi:MAG: GNAT family N-acetyltransferase [Mycobacteriales bacterium]|nr:GNAT family N-acetyltransferase [Frankia sp.]